jgi:uncharacterized membrane protein
MVTKNNTKTVSKGLDSNETMTAVLSYLGFLVFIPLLSIEKKKRNEFIKFHMQQGLNLFIIEVILAIIFAILDSVLFVFGIIGNILYVLFVVVSIIAIIKAMNKEKWPIPVIENLKIVKL